MQDSKQKERVSNITALIVLISLFGLVYVVFGNKLATKTNLGLYTSTNSGLEYTINTASENYTTLANSNKDQNKTISEVSNKECLIKGNISDKGERIYHTPGAPYYSKVTMEPEKGERWFCTEEEAINAGWRKEEASLYKSNILTKEEQNEYEEFELEMERDAKREIENMQGDVPSSTEW